MASRGMPEFAKAALHGLLRVVLSKHRPPSAAMQETPERTQKPLMQQQERLQGSLWEALKPVMRPLCLLIVLRRLPGRQSAVTSQAPLMVLSH